MTKIVYLLSLNRYSRSGRKNNKPKKIVVHHAPKECCGAIETRNYFDNLKIGKNAVYYSTHYIIGLDGEIIHCIPEDEVANHRGDGNESGGCISITCCFRANTCQPGYNTLNSLKSLVRDIVMRYGFSVADDLLRHYDVSGMKCPLFFVQNERKWEALKKDIINETALCDYLCQHSTELAEKLSSATGIEKKILVDIIEGKIVPDNAILARIFELILK